MHPIIDQQKCINAFKGIKQNMKKSRPDRDKEIGKLNIKAILCTYNTICNF